MKRGGLWSVTERRKRHERGWFVVSDRDGSREGKVKRGGLWSVKERRQRHEKGWFVVSDREKEKT